MFGPFLSLAPNPPNPLYDHVSHLSLLTYLHPLPEGLYTCSPEQLVPICGGLYFASLHQFIQQIKTLLSRGAAPDKVRNTAQLDRPMSFDAGPESFEDDFESGFLFVDQKTVQEVVRLAI